MIMGCTKETTDDFSYFWHSCRIGEVPKILCILQLNAVFLVFQITVMLLFYSNVQCIEILVGYCKNIPVNLHQLVTVFILQPDSSLYR